MPSLMQELMDLDTNLWDGFNMSSLTANKLSLVLADAKPALQRDWRRCAFDLLDGACQNALGGMIELEDEVSMNRLEVKYFPVSN